MAFPSAESSPRSCSLMRRASFAEQSVLVLAVTRRRRPSRVDFSDPALALVVFVDRSAAVGSPRHSALLSGGHLRGNMGGIGDISSHTEAHSTWMLGRDQGSVLALQAGGRGFDSHRLHHRREPLKLSVRTRCRRAQRSLLLQQGDRSGGMSRRAFGSSCGRGSATSSSGVPRSDGRVAAVWRNSFGDITGRPAPWQMRSSSRRRFDVSNGLPVLFGKTSPRSLHFGAASFIADTDVR